VVIALAIALSAEPADAAFPGTPGSIAFSRTSPGMGSDIWIAAPGGRERRLTAGAAAAETAPSFSPDGRMIAYVRRVEGDADIWLMRSDGSEKRPLVEGPSDELQPAFYPSGKSIAFTSFDGERGWTVLSVRISGDDTRRQLTEASFPVISPNGRLLAYSRTVAGGGIFVRDQRTGRSRRLTSGSAQELDFSPDGRRIVFTGQRRCRRGSPLRFAMLIVGIGGGRARAIDGDCAAEAISPAWSPDGRRIVYTRKSRSPFAFRLALSSLTGARLAGAPRHRRGGNEIDATWQPLPGSRARNRG
jgi:Tol biopolymer transport system component